MEEDSAAQNPLKRRFNPEILREPRYLAAAAFLAGAIFGLIILGWWLFPVSWTDASAEQLRPDLRESYLRAAIDSYSLNHDESAAQERLNALGDAVDQTMASVAAAPGDQSVETIAHFQSMLGNQVTVGTPPVSGTQSPSQPATGTPLFSTGNLLTTMCGITLVLGLALGAITIFRRRQAGSDRPAALKARDLTRGAQQTDYAGTGESAPLSQWMTTYLIGDGLFDDRSASIRRQENSWVSAVWALPKPSAWAVPNASLPLRSGFLTRTIFKL